MKPHKLSMATAAYPKGVKKRAIKSRCRQIDHKTRLLSDDLKELGSKIVFACIKARNAYLETKIQTQFASRQARLTNSTQNKTMKAYDGNVSICPISAKAFWECRKKEALTGFPTETYTGIPNLANWIRTATIPKREEHVDGLLNRLQTQYNIIRLWSEDEWQRSRIEISRECFEANVLTTIFRSMKQVYLTPLSKITTLTYHRILTGIGHISIEPSRRKILSKTGMIRLANAQDNAQTP